MENPASRQLLVWKAAAGILLTALIACAGFFVYQRYATQPVAVLLDGKPITVVANIATAESLLSQAERAKAGGAFPDAAIVRMQRVQYRHVPISTAVIDPTAIARAKLVKSLKIHVHAFIIVIDGRPTIGLPTDVMAAATLTIVKDHYADMPPNAKIIGEPSFRQRVRIEPGAIDGDHIRASPEIAAPIFWSPPPSRPYVVKYGDLGGTIARKNHISLTDLMISNPDTNLNDLHPGDVLHIQKRPMMLSVQVTKELTRQEKILPYAPASEAGLRSVVYDVTYVNGQELSRTEVSLQTIVRPTTRMSL